MTSPARVDSAIVQKIIDHYAMIEPDIAQLAAQLTRQLTITYRTVIQAQLTLYQCQKIATGPDNQASQWIETKARQDAEGIARTYNRELASKVRSIYKDNKRTNRYGYMAALDAWIAQRNGYKVQSISLNTMTAAREYAKDRFITENGIEGKFVLTGPPPVCKLCIRIKGLGPITYKQTRLPRNRLPQHAGCPHTYGQLIPKKITCETAWTG